MLNGILFRARTGIPWRGLPERFGSWKTVHEGHRRWSAEGTWDRMPRAVQADATLRAGSTGAWSASTRRPAVATSMRPGGSGRPGANEVERTINRTKNSRAVATRYGKRACVFRGSVATAAIRSWLRP
ncbi:hypothetical protein GCM10010393_57140 [Streptomyces gobitricini]|uniref:Insertion element IS402-like domain-containing protein n=1 Tax=Streptomyces gobitricini TaxID=68211 RepID=A0ABN3N9E5_9ACTN